MGGTQDFAFDSEKLARDLTEGKAVGISFDTTDIEFLFHCVDHRGNCFSALIENENREPTMEESAIILRLSSLYEKLAGMLQEARDEDNADDE